MCSQEKSMQQTRRRLHVRACAKLLAPLTLWEGATGRRSSGHSELLLEALCLSRIDHDFAMTWPLHVSARETHGFKRRPQYPHIRSTQSEFAMRDVVSKDLA